MVQNDLLGCIAEAISCSEPTDAIWILPVRLRSGYSEMLIPEVRIGWHAFKLLPCEVFAISTYPARRNFDADRDASSSEFLQSRSLHVPNFESPSAIATIDLPDFRVEIRPIVEAVETPFNVSVDTCC